MGLTLMLPWAGSFEPSATISLTVALGCADDGFK